MKPIYAVRVSLQVVGYKGEWNGAEMMSDDEQDKVERLVEHYQGVELGEARKVFRRLAGREREIGEGVREDGNQ